MNVKPGTIDWARVAVLNAQQSLQRANVVLAMNGLMNEAGFADQLCQACDELASSLVVEPTKPEPRRA
jgi:hypothetical protein